MKRESFVCYASPSVEVAEISVESGFAATAGTAGLNGGALTPDEIGTI